MHDAIVVHLAAWLLRPLCNSVTVPLIPDNSFHPKVPSSPA